MSGHRVIADLAASKHAYATDSVSNIISVGTGLPDGNTPGYIFIRTDGTDEDARLYVRGDTTANDWGSIAGAVP